MAVLVPLNRFRGLVRNHFHWLPSLSVVACPLDPIKEFLSPFFLASDSIKDITLLLINDYQSRWVDLVVIRIFRCLFEVGDGDDWVDALQPFRKFKFIGIFAYSSFDPKGSFLNDGQLVGIRELVANVSGF